MVDWHHRAKGLALLAAVVLIGSLVAARNPDAVGLGAVGLLVFGIVSMLVGLAWLFLTAFAEE